MIQHTRYPAALLVAALLGTAATAGCGGPEPRRTGPDGSQKAAAPTAGRDEGFTLVATGDVLAHDSVIRQAAADADGTADSHDFRPMLAGAAPVVAEADLALCHLETVFGADGGPFTGYPVFRTPPHVARALAETGYDSCSTASNHTLDAGAEGVTRTLDALDAAGLAHVGSARSAAERDRPALLEAGGARVAQLAYTYGTNGVPVPADQPYLVNLIDADRIVADARAARRAGADVVVVSVHWGTEWQEAPDARQLSLARRLTASRTGDRRDIDLVLGTHAHVPQPYEKVGGTWVVYGMGDQVAGVMNDPRGQLGSAARFTFAPPHREGDAWRVVRAEFVPHVMDNDPLRVVNVPRALADDPGHAGYTTARDVVRDAAVSRGAAGDGLTMGR
ncbi:CapA family protein [Streptomyces sp. TRM 70351]|uniref:CapA family protein n=1 Tax=Streptomyces sp. TRM 70351 TaxID=3116552 RepID=UPI002E7B6B79|nr:CapA family protein [Streptomyces sp. TRM 70351]MEE1930536.1 CapA family protein [Streptomyces sp. TRM 70351]